MKRRKRNRKNDTKKIMFLGIFALCFISVGYSVLSSTLKINGTAKITSSWNIIIDSITKTGSEGTAEEVSAPTNDSTTATFNVSLKQPGDSIIYEVVVKNNGSLHALLKSIETSPESSLNSTTGIKYTFSGNAVNDKLLSGGTHEFNVKVEWISTDTEVPEETNKTITVTMNYSQYGGSTYPDGVDPNADILLTGNMLESLKQEGKSESGTLEKIEQPATEQTSAQTEYRYRGSNPNNYVTFNGETWRIIGIVDGKVKLIRNESIGSYAWNSSSNVNEWPSATLKTYLNETYYNGLSTEAKGMIENSTWYLGGWNTSDIKTNVMYEKERGTTVYSGRSTKTIGNIAIMYPSDYGYAASNSCSNSYTLGYYNNTTCTDNNWLYNSSIDQWTLAPYSGSSVGAFPVSRSGYVGEGGVGSVLGVRPTIYLKSDVLISSGDGSSSTPYQLTLG